VSSTFEKCPASQREAPARGPSLNSFPNSSLGTHPLEAPLRVRTFDAAIQFREAELRGSVFPGGSLGTRVARHPVARAESHRALSRTRFLLTRRIRYFRFCFRWRVSDQSSGNARGHEAGRPGVSNVSRPIDPSSSSNRNTLMTIPFLVTPDAAEFCESFRGLYQSAARRHGRLKTCALRNQRLFVLNTFGADRRRKSDPVFRINTPRVRRQSGVATTTESTQAEAERWRLPRAECFRGP
jgi:hypothetical protein